MGFLSNFRKDLDNAKRNKAANINGKNLKELLIKFKEERDRIERRLELDLKLIAPLKCLCKKS